MLDNVVADREFAKIMKNSIVELIVHFFQKEQNFGILCNIADASFEPQLPEKINSNFNQLTLFFLAGYTFETARIEDDFLVFEAGFGEENFGSVVTIPLLSIMQIIVDETPLFINLSTLKEMDTEEEKIEEKVDKNGVKNSMASFLSNPENSKFLK
jgi:hypothetical protein